MSHFLAHIVHGRVLSSSSPTGGQTRFKRLLLINILKHSHAHLVSLNMTVSKLLEFPIIRAGLVFEYTTPAITVTLHHVVYQYPCKDGSCKVFDGFMKQCPLLEVNLLALAAIEDDEAKAWFINVRK